MYLCFRIVYDIKQRVNMVDFTQVMYAVSYVDLHGVDAGHLLGRLAYRLAQDAPEESSRCLAIRLSWTAFSLLQDPCHGITHA